LFCGRKTFISRKEALFFRKGALFFHKEAFAFRKKTFVFRKENSTHDDFDLPVTPFFGAPACSGGGAVKSMLLYSLYKQIIRYKFFTTPPAFLFIFAVFQADMVRYIYSNFLKLHLDSSFTVNYNSILFASPPENIAPSKNTINVILHRKINPLPLHSEIRIIYGVNLKTRVLHKK
jgi:hypothetical protein